MPKLKAVGTRFGHIARTGNSTSIALRAFEWLPGSKGA